MKFDGWSTQAIELLEKAIARHGGQRWEKTRRVTFCIDALRGPIPYTKGVHKTFPLPQSVEVWPHQQRTIFRGYPRPGQHGIFQGGDVTLFDDDVPIESHPKHRATFQGLFRRYGRWSPADALYFFGYALLNYLSLPFLLADLPLLSVPRCRYQGRELLGVEVQFPDGFDTHSKVQRFFFEEDGLLVRHDYTADIISPLAQGAHFTTNYLEVSGVPFAQKREVFAAPFGRVTPLMVLEGSLRNFAVESDD